MQTLVRTIAASVLGMALATQVLAQDKPVVIRAGYLGPPPAQMMSVFTLKPELLKHHGKTYTVEPRQMRGVTIMVTAFAAGELDFGWAGFTSLHHAIANAGLTDVRVIGDEAEDGFHGKFSSEFRVRKDSGIDKISDLKGKIVGISSRGGAGDVLVRYTLRKHGVEASDYTYLETGFATMKAMLLQKKIDAGYFIPPFAFDPEVAEQTKVLFTIDTEFGPIMQNFMVSRGAFIAKNRAAMVDFLEDFLRVARWYYDPKNRDEAIKIVSEISKVPAEALRGFIFTDRDNYRNMDGLPDLNVIQSNWAVMKELGLSRRDLNINDYADLSLMKEAAARLNR